MSSTPHPSEETASSRPVPSSCRWVVAALLVLSILAIYARTMHYGFVSIDDFEYVRDNPNVNAGLSWSSFRWAFTHPVAGNWHPLTMLSHMLDCQIYGLSPGGHHLTNVLLHIANTLLLFCVLLKMTRDPRAGEGDGSSKFFWPCAVVAALFAVHPLRVESVAWISERKDVLSGLFFMLTLWAYVNYTRIASKYIWYTLSLIFFALGLMSKPMLVTVPCVLLLLDYWPLRRTGAVKCAVEKIPFFILTILCSAITFFMQKKAGAVVALEEFPLKARLANAIISYARYLGKTFWPDSLSVLYPQQSWSQLQVAAAIALFVLLTVLSLRALRRKRFLFVGWFIFAGMLLPVSGIFQVGDQAMADRFCYLPLFGIFIAVVWLIAESPLRRFLVPIGAVVTALLIVISAKQANYWENSQSLFEHALQVSPDNSTAHHFLGVILLDSGNIAAAEQHFNQAIQSNPANVRARNALGYIFSQQHKWAEASEQYEIALRIEPDSAKAHIGLAEVLAKRGRPDLAINHYVLALQSNPDIAEAHFQLGSALLSGKQDTAQAIAYLQNAVHLAPDWPLALNALSWTLATHPDAKFRNGPEAVRLAQQAVILTKNDPGTIDTLAAAYAEAGQFTNAVATAEEAIQKATATGQTNLAAEITSRLKLFQARQAYREP